MVGLAVTTAQAGFVITHPQPVPVDSNYPYFSTGPFNFDPEVAVSGSRVWSGAQYRETRVSNLPTGPGGTLKTLNEEAASGMITTTQVGQSVGAHSSQPVPEPGPLALCVAGLLGLLLCTQRRRVLKPATPTTQSQAAKNMSITSPLTRTLTIAMMMAAGPLLPSAHAGIVINTLPPGGDDVFRTVLSGALDLHWWQMTEGNGTAAQARYVETRTSQLINSTSKGLEYQKLVADSGWVTTTQRGKAVSADASIDTVDHIPTVPPAVAKVSAFGNHAHAHTTVRLAMENDVDVNVQGVAYPAYSIFKISSNTARARTAWYDTWQADMSGNFPLTLSLDGSLREDATCVVQNCGLIIPPGITSVQTRSPQMAFWASFTVLDLDTLVYCDDADLCWVGDPFPKTVAQLEARYMRDPEDSLPLFHDTTHQLSFEAIAGHRYLTIGLMEVETSNGGRVSFDNSLRLTGVAAPEGALRSSVVGGDLASAFLTPVPEPASEWLWMAGLGLLALRRRPERA